MAAKTNIIESGSLSEFILNKSNALLKSEGLTGEYFNISRTAILLFGVVLLSLLIWWVTRKILIEIIHAIAGKSKTKWDDYLVEKRFFSAIAHLVPLIFMDSFIKVVFYSYPKMSVFLMKTTDLVILFVILIAMLRFLSTFEKILSEKDRLKDKPVQSYFQLGKILVSGIMIILGLSIATGQSPIYFLTSLGAMTAILLLVFKDTILGFVGSIQLAANDMVRIGDWITMEKYGADGDVVEITLATVKVQNFDKTITTIPTYSFISDSFKNWRGMEQSDGRRIKRSINLEINSIKFCTEELLDKLKKIDFLRDHIDNREVEIKEFNNQNNVTRDYLLNGRNQTNIGLFRHYVTAYLKNNPHINQDMTLMVRQLAPTPMGVPVEVYCFSNTKEWGPYENIVADIFDHLFSATSYFGLTVFERPSGKDVSGMLDE
jgi:miniconductance mechanosensitive channel